MLAALSFGVIAVFAAIFFLSLARGCADWQSWVAGQVPCVLGSSLFGFCGALCAVRRRSSGRSSQEFFKKLDTPVDVAREVFGAGRKQISTFPLVGGTTIVMGLLMGLILFTDISCGGAV